MRSFGNALGAFNSFLNELAYKPKGSKQSYLFYLPWLNHDTNATFNLDDPAGADRAEPDLDLLQRHAISPTALRRKSRTCRPLLQGANLPRRANCRRSRPSPNIPPFRLRPRNRMSKRAPSTTQLLVIAGFALSCFGILLFLWITFGGPTPFKAKPYEIEIPFNEATQLAQQSDVRISGVSVGKVQDIVLAPDGEQALAKVDINDKYGPIPRDTRAILRTKTLLGETYIELTPGDRNGPVLADGGTLPKAQIAESVQLDEIFRTFDPRTRAAFQSWQQEAAVAIAGRGADLSYAFGEFEPAFTQFDHLFRQLDSQRLAVKQLFRNGATSLRALRGRQGELAGLIQNSNAVFSTTAARDREIEALFRAFPTFQDESRLTLNRLKTFSIDADPVMQQLVPVAEQLSPTLIALSKFAPQAKGLLRRARTGDRPRPDRLPGPAQALPRPVPAAAARGRSLPAQPQPDPHRPRPLQA